MSIREQKRRLNSPVGLGFDQEAVFRLPLGRTLQSLVINHDVARSVMPRLAIEINGQETVINDAAFFNTVEAHRGVHTDANKTVIRFGEMINNTLAGQMFGGLPLLPNDNAVLKIQIGTGTGTPVITVDAFTTNLTDRLFIYRMRTVTAQVVVNGESSFSTLTTAAGVKIKRLWFKATDIAKIIIRQGGKRIWESTDADNNYDLQVAGRVPQSGYFCFDPAADGWGIDGLLDTISSTTPLEFIIETNDPTRTDNSMPIIVEQIDQIKAIG